LRLLDRLELRPRVIEECAVVFQYGRFAKVAEGVSKDLRSLLYDAGERNHIDHAAHAVQNGVV